MSFVFQGILKTSSRCLEDALEDKNCYAKYILKTSKASSRLLGDQRMFPRCTTLGIPKAGKFKQKEKLETVLKWGKFYFNVILDHTKSIPEK